MGERERGGWVRGREGGGGEGERVGEFIGCEAAM